LVLSNSITPTALFLLLPTFFSLSSSDLFLFFHANQTPRQLAIAPVIDPIIVPIKAAVLRLLLPLEPKEDELGVAFVGAESVVGNAEVAVVVVDARNFDVSVV
jgi:hypothetical protein